MSETCISRTFDAGLLNAIANSANVRPLLLGDGAIDLTATLASAANVGLVTARGGFVMVNQGGGDYEVHTIFERGAGDLAVKAMFAGFEYMFGRTDCLRLTTKLPDGNTQAALLASTGGFAHLFRNPVTDVDCVELTIDRWAMASAAMEALGGWFHEIIDAAHPNLPDHPADAMHDRAVGAAVLMFRAGNSGKATWFYNRWAAHAGYPGIRLLSSQPAVIDMGEVVVEVLGDNMGVLLCR